jgi:hypothetical protein
MEFWDVYEGSESRVALPHPIDQLIALPDDQMASSDYAFVIHLWSHEGTCLGELLRLERPVGGLAWQNGILAVCTLDEVALFRNGVKFSAVEHDFVRPTPHGEDHGTFFVFLDDGAVLLSSWKRIHAWKNEWEEVPLPALPRVVVGLDRCRFVGVEETTRRLLAFE